MANRFTRHIPNTVTCCNLFAGCIATVMAYEMRYDLALLFIVMAAVFDFFDGMLARLLDARSPIGKDIDSLADDISFGLAPAMIAFSLLRESDWPEALAPFASWLPYAGFLLSVFSALRLAKFNIDPRQTSSFIGMPTPANTLFWASLAAGAHGVFVGSTYGGVCLLVLVGLMSGLLVCELPMFSLKFKNLSWRDHRLRYVFLLGCVPLFALLGVAGFAAVIVWYLVLSLVTFRRGQ